MRFETAESNNKRVNQDMNVAKKIGILFLCITIIGVHPLFSKDKAFAAPTATIEMADEVLAIGQTTEVKIAFSETVTGLDIYDLTADNGALSNLRTNDNITYFVTLTPAPNVTDDTNLVTLNNSGVSSGSGAGVGTTSSNNYSVDTVEPIVTSVSVPAVGSYGIGRNLDFTVHMSEPVFVTGVPSIPLTIGTTAVEATYVSGTGADALFRYTVQAGLLDANGITVGTALTLHGGSMEDQAGNDADITLFNVGSTDNLFVESIPPAITGIQVPSAATYKTDDPLDFTVTLSENVTVTGTPSIALTIGDTSVQADYVSGSGTSSLAFRYTVQAGLTDTDGIALEALHLNGGSVRDAIGNDADLTINGAGDTSGVLIDSAAPAITGHAIGNDNAYVDVNFSEGIFASSNGTGAVSPSDLRLIFAKNSGDASAASVPSLKRTDGGELTGGETAIRVMLDITGIPTGDETIEIVPADGASIYDLAGNAAEGSQSTGPIRLLDLRDPVISPVSASFDKYAGASANRDVTTTLTLRGKTLIGISKGATPLVPGTDYTVAGGTVTIPKAYLAAQPVGTTALTFLFSGATAKTLAITVSDTTPPRGSSGNGSTPVVTGPVIDLDGIKLTPDQIDTTKPSFTLEVTPKDGTAHVSVPASFLTTLEGRNAAFMIEIKAPYGSYQIPVHLASLIPGLNELLANHDLKAEEINFQITLTDKSGNKDMQAALARGLPDGKAMGAIVDYRIDIIDSRTGAPVGTADRFGSALTRVIPMPKDMTNLPAQWGAFRYNESTRRFEFVPAKKVRIDGVWYVMIRSYSNSVYVAADNAVSYTDASKHWGQPFIELAAAKGLVDGVGDGKYDPDRKVTRAEFAALLVRSLGRGTSTDAASPYEDVKTGSRYYGDVAKAKELGLLKFVTGNNFKPDQPLTREEMASMLAAVLTLEKLPIAKESVSLAGYKDIGNVDASYSDDVRLMVNDRIMEGTGEDTFSPKGETTRAQAAVVFIRMLRLLEWID